MSNNRIPDKLRRELSEAIDAQPALVQDLLALAAEKMTAYQEQLRRQRNNTASNALTMLSKLPSRKKLLANPALLLDFVWCQYSGDLMAVRTVHDDALRDVFIEAVRAHPLDPEWVRMTRGDDCARWYKVNLMPFRECDEPNAELPGMTAALLFSDGRRFCFVDDNVADWTGGSSDVSGRGSAQSPACRQHPDWVKGWDSVTRQK